MPRTTRREFARTLTAAGAAVAVSGAAAQETESKPSPLAAAWTHLVRAQYGQFLSDAEMTRIAKDFADYAPYIEGFRDVKLKNSDEPDFTFHSLTDRW